MSDTSLIMQFQTEELEYMIWDFILEGKNRTEHRPGVEGQGWGLTMGNGNEEYK